MPDIEEPPPPLPKSARQKVEESTSYFDQAFKKQFAGTSVGRTAKRFLLSFAILQLLFGFCMAITIAAAQHVSEYRSIIRESLDGFSLAVLLVVTATTELVLGSYAMWIISNWRSLTTSRPLLLASLRIYVVATWFNVGVTFTCMCLFYIVFQNHKGGKAVTPFQVLYNIYLVPYLLAAQYSCMNLNYYVVEISGGGIIAEPDEFHSLDTPTMYDKTYFECFMIYCCPRRSIRPENVSGTKKSTWCFDLTGKNGVCRSCAYFFYCKCLHNKEAGSNKRRDLYAGSPPHSRRSKPFYSSSPHHSVHISGFPVSPHMTRKNGTVVLDLNVERKADSDDDDEVSDIVDMYESPKERAKYMERMTPIKRSASNSYSLKEPRIHSSYSHNRIQGKSQRLLSNSREEVEEGPKEKLSVPLVTWMGSRDASYMNDNPSTNDFDVTHSSDDFFIESMGGGLKRVPKENEKAIYEPVQPNLSLQSYNSLPHTKVQPEANSFEVQGAANKSSSKEIEEESKEACEVPRRYIDELDQLVAPWMKLETQ